MARTPPNLTAVGAVYLINNKAHNDDNDDNDYDDGDDGDNEEDDADDNDDENDRWYNRLFFTWWQKGSLHTVRDISTTDSWLP